MHVLWNLASILSTSMLASHCLLASTCVCVLTACLYAAASACLLPACMQLHLRAYCLLVCNCIWLLTACLHATAFGCLLPACMQLRLGAYCLLACNCVWVQVRVRKAFDAMTSSPFCVVRRCRSSATGCTYPFSDDSVIKAWSGHIKLQKTDIGCYPLIVKRVRLLHVSFGALSSHSQLHSEAVITLTTVITPTTPQ